jgi:hypothetical protein
MTTPPPTPTLDDPEQLSVAVELCRNGKIRTADKAAGNIVVGHSDPQYATYSRAGALG